MRRKFLEKNWVRTQMTWNFMISDFSGWIFSLQISWRKELFFPQKFRPVLPAQSPATLPEGLTSVSRPALFRLHLVYVPGVAQQSHPVAPLQRTCYIFIFCNQTTAVGIQTFSKFAKLTKLTISYKIKHHRTNFCLCSIDTSRLCAPHHRTMLCGIVLYKQYLDRCSPV